MITSGKYNDASRVMRSCLEQAQVKPEKKSVRILSERRPVKNNFIET